MDTGAVFWRTWTLESPAHWNLEGQRADVAVDLMIGLLTGYKMQQKS